MKFSQVILLVLIVNLLNVVVGFSINMGTISNFEEELTSWFTGSKGFTSQLSDFSSRVKSQESWLPSFVGEALSGLTSAINMVIISFQIILLILWSWLTPIVSVMTDDLAESIPFLIILGFAAILYLTWFNVMAIIKLWKFIKGSDQ